MWDNLKQEIDELANRSSGRKSKFESSPEN